ncbi:transcription factor HES-4 [Lagenorhynchus albirostris]|uniref:transcription factor HES-4 n=1 Tax=Lagenorhynchus albirostris TaxID=27610 RepID=UPI0028F105D1|nr:transcription factor HES-4 [Lagenorhynchus albirostris]
MTSSCLTDDVTPPALWHHVHWSRDATLPVYDLGRPACLLPSGWCSTSTVSRASCRCCSRRGSDSQAARRPEGPAGSAESRGVRAEARRLLGGASPGSPREFSFQISRGPSSPRSQAAGSARSVPEPGARGRGAREAVRPARPRPRAARGRTMPADTPGKLRASPRAGAPAGARRTPDQPRSAAEHRKSSKPVMEKRRRARINESLAQLQSLLLDALRKESSRRSKLEKADILELTVKHLQSLRRVQVTAALRADPAVLGKYRAGFHECLAEVNRFLAGCEGVPADVRSRLLGHLATCLARLGPLRRPLPPAPAAEVLAPAVYAGRSPPPAFDGPCPLPRSRAVLAPPFLPGRTGEPLAAPGAAAQGRGAPWRPWLW